MLRINCTGKLLTIMNCIVNLGNRRFNYLLCYVIFLNVILCYVIVIYNI